MTIRFIGPLSGGLVYSLALAVASIGVTPGATVSAYAQSQVATQYGTGDFAKDPKKKSIVKKKSNIDHSTKGHRVGGGGGDPQGIVQHGRRL